jgi:hypothetical protein
MSIAEAIKLSHYDARKEWPTGWEAISAPDFWFAYYLINNAMMAGKDAPERDGYSPSDLLSAGNRLILLAETKTATIKSCQSALGIR